MHRRVWVGVCRGDPCSGLLAGGWVCQACWCCRPRPPPRPSPARCPAHPPPRPARLLVPPPLPPHLTSAPLTPVFHPAFPASLLSIARARPSRPPPPPPSHAHARGIDALSQRIFRQGSFSAARCRLCSGRLPFLLSTWRRVTSSGLTTQSHGSVQVVKFRHGW